MLSNESLTDEQKAVVRHDGGLAVVRAVPGAGKTTAMTHRIRHLIEARSVRPHSILACSFNRATVRDLQAGLQSLGVSGVRVQTLHALGRSILSHARDDGPNSSPGDAGPAPDAAARMLAYRALTDLASDRRTVVSDLEMSVSDVVDQVSSWKQHLAHPDLDGANLPPPVREQMVQATHANDDVLTLYRHFEAHRQDEGWTTYPDMPLEAWKTLVRDEALRDSIQERYRFVLVDEFQDVSRAQFRMLMTIMTEDGNGMVIGDADQCIYGWRGADPTYLASFADRYDATEYRMSESFRLPAGPLVLGAAVIAKNDDRPEKSPTLTQGFEGRTAVLSPPSRKEADAVADRIVSLLEDGVAPDDVAVLVRTYAQTPPLERAFLTRECPYRLQGHCRFYRRPEAQTILRYLYWAVLERKRRRAGGFDDAGEEERYYDRFAHILTHPDRVLEPAQIKNIRQKANADDDAVLAVLNDRRPSMSDDAAHRVGRFLEIASGLVQRVDEAAPDVVEWLADNLGYEVESEDGTSGPRRPNGQIQTVRSLIRWAAPCETVASFLQQVRERAREETRRHESSPSIDIRSIHRAKGAEWPIVVIPGCTDGTLPLASDGLTRRSLDEERRLFYVAITRASQHLYLITPSQKPRSPFLEDVEAERLLERVSGIQTLLGTSPRTLENQDLQELCTSIIDLGVDAFFRKWWTPTSELKAGFATRLDRFEGRVHQAHKRVSAYRQSYAEYRAETEAARAQAKEDVDTLRGKLGERRIRAQSEAGNLRLPKDAHLTFQWMDDDSQMGVFWDDTRVGRFDPLSATEANPQVLLSIPWEATVGRLERVASGRGLLTVRIDWEATALEAAQRAGASLSPPPPPSDLDRALTQPSFIAGYELLREVVTSGSDAS